MLMIDGVVFQMLHQIGQRRGFDDEGAVGGEEAFHRRHHRVQIIDMGEHVGGRDHFCRPHFGAGGFGRSGVEEAAHGLDPALISDLHDVGRGVDAENAEAIGGEFLQQDPDVTAEVHHQVFTAKTQHLGRRAGEFVPMLLSRARYRGLIRIVLAVKNLGVHDMAQLDQTTTATA